MTSFWEETLRGLRGEFVRGSLQRLDHMSELVQTLEARPADKAARHELMLQFHGLAGAGTTYGFPEVTRLGLLGERMCGGREDVTLDAVMLAGTKARLGEIRAALTREAGVADEPLAPLEGAPPPRPQVLLVEDDAATRGLFAARLDQEGYDVRSVGSRGEAFAALEERMPDAIVCDVMLPDGNGHSLVSAVRQHAAGDQVAIVMVSVRADFVDKVEALTSGADGYFEKPVDWEALLRRLQHLVERHQQAPARVLCVEDFGEQAAFLRTVLSAAGYKVETLCDPRGFESAMTTFRPDIVLMDVLLPGISGYDLTRYLRQHPRFASLPVLFLTTEAQPEARLQGLKAGGDDFIVKPASPALLLTTVASHLERARLLRSYMERDGLTRLLTHSAFLDRLREAYDRARRHPEHRPVLVMMDLDAFKAVNDRHGHAAGDRVLMAFASLVRQRLRHSDVVGRYGGEEFAILIEALDEADAVRLSERLRQDFGAAEHPAPDGSRFHVTLSAGIASLYTAAMSFEAWKKAADDALYRAKAEGRNRIFTAPPPGPQPGA